MCSWRPNEQPQRPDPNNPPPEPKEDKGGARMLHTTCLRCGNAAISIPWMYADVVGYVRYSYCEDCLRAGMRELKGRRKAQKPIMAWYCPKCEAELAEMEERCHDCGQLIDWT